MITVKRIYDPPAPDDGFRVLVDRLWPRGVSKARADIDLWLKEIAPSTELRRWFHQDPSLEGEHFGEFRTRYEHELDTNPAVPQLRTLTKTHPRVTLLVSIRDLELNHATILIAYLSTHP
ncbi:DUF488 domain-containing protein [Leifsonia sp. 2MCAF36]|uniref:DUF488 domain-containing protein n=1 Tax=Leifsonia sp. 2MCAF36 TaxID=3232988 RepID=UPI003F9BD233